MRKTRRSYGRLAAADARVGLRVLYLGATTTSMVEPGSPEGVGVLQHLHPGVISVDDRWHMLVSWIGIEDQPASTMLGFSTDDSDSFYPGLHAATPEEWAEAVKRVSSR